jgi:opacity protein-like surface antigen
MKVCTRMLATLAVVALAMPLLHAQNASQPEHGYNYTPRVELFLGYTHFGTWSNNAATGNRMVGLNGGSASLAFNLNRYLGLVADFGGYDVSQLQLTGNGANQPLVVNASGTAYTFLGGPRLSFRNSTRFTPFAQALFGDVHATAVSVSNCSSACTPLPAQDAFAMTAGAGLDIALTRHISLRAVQAEYMMTRFAALPATGPGTTQNDLRLSTGLVFRFGDLKPPPPVQLACSIQPATAYPGDPINVTATATNLNPKRHASYNFATNGGTLSGSGATTMVNTTAMMPGSYAVSGHVTQGPRPEQQASCTVSFTIQSPAPPTIACSAAPSSVNPGDTAAITSQANSPQDRTLTYSYSATAGTVTGNTAAATLATSGAAPGTITVTCNVVDDLGKSASSTTNVTVLAPPPVVAPQTSDLCSISFDRDRKRPTRVDNEAKGCLDDIALTLQHDSASRLVIVGNYGNDEKPEAGAARSRNAGQYLTEEKGIDAARIDTRTGSDSGRTATDVLVPAGATYAGDSK